MNNKFLLKYEKQIHRIPIYLVWVIYIFRFKRFAYFMSFENFRREKIVKQILYAIVGIKAIDIILNLRYILSSDDSDSVINKNNSDI
jgi:hypothetical protein